MDTGHLLEGLLAPVQAWWPGACDDANTSGMWFPRILLQKIRRDAIEIITTKCCWGWCIVSKRSTTGRAAMSSKSHCPRLPHTLQSQRPRTRNGSMNAIFFQLLPAALPLLRAVPCRWLALSRIVERGHMMVADEHEYSSVMKSAWCSGFAFKRWWWTKFCDFTSTIQFVFV